METVVLNLSNQMAGFAKAIGKDVSGGNLLRFFEYKQLPEDLQPISKKIHDLAHEMCSELPANTERAAGLRKLLEAKDCFVRAAVPEGS